MAKDWVTEEMIKKAQSVNLLDYARSLGMEFESRGSSDTLYWKGHSLNITQSKNLFHRFSTQTGGNVINFAMEMNGWGFQEAVRNLCSDEIMANPNISHREQGQSPTTPKPREEMVLPKANTDSRRVFAYLVKTRKIEPEIVSQLMRERIIYENDKHSCVFVGYDENGKPGYASVRSTYTEGKPYRGDVKNSNKEVGFKINGKSDCVHVFEAPIDALSYASLYKIGGADWQRDHLLALGGTSDLALQNFLKSHTDIKTIYFCLDNDRQGNAVLRNEYNEDGSPKRPGYMKKYKDLGYTVIREAPQSKDFNEDLQNLHKIMEQGEEQAAMEEGMEEALTYE